MPRFPTAVAILILPLFNFTSVDDAAAQSQTDFMNAMDIVGSMQYCDVLQPGFKDATGSQYAAWRAGHQASVAAVESLPQFKARPAVTEASVTPQQRAAYSKKCPRLQRYFTRV